jgi:hypothetical protein
LRVLEIIEEENKKFRKIRQMLKEDRKKFILKTIRNLRAEARLRKGYK